MARLIKPVVLWERPIHRDVVWGQEGALFGKQNSLLLRNLATHRMATLLNAQNPYHSLLVVGRRRMPLPVFCALLGFCTMDQDIMFYDQAVNFLRKNCGEDLEERARHEIVTDYSAKRLRAWGQKGKTLWHVFVTPVEKPYRWSATIWTGDPITGTAMSMNVRDNGEVELEGSLPDDLTNIVGLVPECPPAFWTFLATLISPDVLQEYWWGTAWLPNPPVILESRGVDFKKLCSETFPIAYLFFHLLFMLKGFPKDEVLLCLTKDPALHMIKIEVKNHFGWSGTYRLPLITFALILGFPLEMNGLLFENLPWVKFLKSHWNVRVLEA